MALVPPFSEETARAKVKRAEDLWNTRDPERVAQAYTEGSQWRNRDTFLEGRAAIVEFLRDKWRQEQEYRLEKRYFCHSDNRIAVEFEYEFVDCHGQWWRAHGIEHWTFDAQGLMQRRDMSANNVQIHAHQRKLHE